LILNNSFRTPDLILIGLLSGPEEETCFCGVMLLEFDFQLGGKQPPEPVFWGDAFE
jgi:hypothetical protein